MNKKNEKGIVQRTLIGDVAKVLLKIPDGLKTSIYKTLYEKISKIPYQINSADTQAKKSASYNPQNKTLNYDVKNISKMIEMSQNKIIGWEAVAAKEMAGLTHEFTHVVDVETNELPVLTDEISEWSQAWSLYKLELNAWYNEALSYAQSGAEDNSLVQAWLTLTDDYDEKNKIWQRLQFYTDNVFQPHFPPNTKWDNLYKTYAKSEMKKYMLEMKKSFMDELNK